MREIPEKNNFIFESGKLESTRRSQVSCFDEKGSTRQSPVREDIGSKSALDHLDSTKAISTSKTSYQKRRFAS